MTQEKLPLSGCVFILGEVHPEELFFPEDFSDEHKLIQETAQEFMENEVFPRMEEIEKKDFKLLRELMLKCGELGLLSVDIPERFGGVELDKVSTALVSEAVGSYASFAVTHGGHTGIGTLPIVYFGSEEAKQKYLPKLASGEWIAAYALTEPDAGSDALSLKCHAEKLEDGSYVLNGGKIWITNAGFADVFVVFAKVDGEKLSAFVVERNFDGVSIGAEEKKLGIHGSSTASVNLEHVKVPAENLLGEEGIGGKIALNILNFGRFKLGASCLGGMKHVLKITSEYAEERRQFGRAICEFGAIQHKLAEMAVRTWLGESMIYRTAGLLDRALEGSSHDNPSDILKRVENYAVECSIIKVSLSEFLDYCVDEAVQTFGGYGYSSEYPPERFYRDARINRIFEGTNEINRLVITGLLMRKVLKGQLDLMGAIQKTTKEILLPLKPGFATEPFGKERQALEQLKKIFYILAGKAYEVYLDKLVNEQEIVFGLSDLLMLIYAFESGLYRLMKKSNRGTVTELERAFLTVALQNAWSELERIVRECAGMVAEGDDMRLLWGALRKYQYLEPLPAIKARRIIARSVIERKGYPIHA